MFATILIRVLPPFLFSPCDGCGIPGLLIAKNFCGSILADCFVLTPHNNQLRHCQRNTHRSRVQPPVPPPASLRQDADWSLQCTSTCESGSTDTHTFMPIFFLVVVVGQQRPHTKGPRGCGASVPTARSSVRKVAEKISSWNKPNLVVYGCKIKTNIWLDSFSF